MNAVAEDLQTWSRVRWVTSITLVVATQLVLALAFSNRPAIKQRRAATTRVILPERVPAEFQELTDPALLALGGPRSFSAIWLEPFTLQPLVTDWQQPPHWLSLESEALGGGFLEFAQSNAASLQGAAFKTQPQTSPVKPLASPKPLRTASTLRAAGDLADRAVLTHPDLPSWPAKDLLIPSEVRVLVDARGLVTSAILQSGSGSTAADQFAVKAAWQTRFTPVPRGAESAPLTMGQLIFEWHAKPDIDSAKPVKSQIPQE